MKAALKYLTINILALVIGWVIGYYSQPASETEIKKVYVDKVKKEIIRDTVKLTTPVYIETDKSDSLIGSDSLNLTSIDSTMLDTIDTMEVIDEDIIREQLISSKNMEVEWITNDSIDVSELLNKKANSFNEVMVIEFWQSPLNLTGYELNRNKLKLFGFNPEESISLQVKDDKSELILRSRSFTLFLPKTNQFKTVDL
mgnify:CR=1 FL=1|tara:strand:+ start:101078 stop:101674 length:597 start_codon:yes stop_codon:yes gene_type:complete